MSVISKIYNVGNGEWVAIFSDGVAIRAMQDYPQEKDFYAFRISSPGKPGERFMPHDASGLVEREITPEHQPYIRTATLGWQDIIDGKRAVIL